MNAGAWLLTTLMLIAPLVAYLSKRRSVYKIMATSLVLFTLFGCEIGVYAAARGVVALANANRELSPGFQLGVERLLDALSALRWLLSLSALCLYGLILFPPRHEIRTTAP
jgi:hypothetical protein